MYLLLNGAFGVGKSTVARELRAGIPNCAIFDPEWVGLPLMRLSFRSVSDFQDLPRWRSWTILGARLVGAHRSTVIIPMAFSEPAYLDEVRRGLARSGRPVLHFCLTASIDIVKQRLAARGEAVDDPQFAWVHRRAIECCEAHQAAVFATHVPTDSRSAADVADGIRKLVCPVAT